MAFFAVPLAVISGLIGSLFSSTNAIAYGILGIAIPQLLLAGMWVLYSEEVPLPEKASQLFLPLVIAFCYYLCIWTLAFGPFHYNTFFPYLFLTKRPLFFPLVPAAITIVTALSVVVTCKIIKNNIIFNKKAIIAYCSAALFLSGIVALQYYDRSSKIIFKDHQVERIEDEVKLFEYFPFSTDNRLQKLDEPATISFTENYPKLDGATALYPVYAAIVQELYKGLDNENARYYISCTTTREAYQHLIDGRIDIFFGLQPSQQQMDAAKEKGVELLLTPIAKEAFVFFVNKDNPVNSLTVEQIQDIYQKKITNWKTVGGKAKKIIPFQRPENSGSQTIMLARVMGDKPLPPPLKEEFAGTMGGIINRVAAYRNYSSSIGYSFRFFATGMKPNTQIKLLAVNGIAPSIENIQNGSYPFTVNVYAVTAGSTNENTQKLIQWILSEQGQGFIEKCGYVRVE